MTPRHLALGAAVVLANLHCQGDCGQWESAEQLDLGVADDLHAITWYAPDPPYRTLAVGAGGVIVDRSDDDLEIAHPVTADLHAVLITPTFAIAVGDRGTVVRTGHLDNSPWTTVAAGTTADLHALVAVGDDLFVAGDAAVLHHDAASDTWTELSPPNGGWGPLRMAVHTAAGTVVAGLGGLAWTTPTPDDLLTPWTRLSLATDADLLAGESDVIVGRRGAVRVRLGADWISVDAPVDADFVAVARIPELYNPGPETHTLLAADGRVFDLDPAERTLTESTTLAPDLRALVSTRSEYSARVLGVGPAGAAELREYRGCEPWLE